MGLRYLPWDSDFFDIKIGRVDCSADEVETTFSRRGEFQAQGYKLIYIFCPHENKSSFLDKPIDVKRVYCKEITKAEKYNPEIQTYNGAPDDLYDLAYQSGFDSRYKLDDRFKKGEFERLYRVWVDNSVNHQIADVVFVAKCGSAISGFITLTIKKGEGSIGLLATDEKFRGKGIGTSLVETCVNYLFEHKVSKIYVATQITNFSACHFYEKCGMSVCSETDIYHLWL